MNLRYVMKNFLFEADSSKSEVAQIIDNTPIEYLNRTLNTRNPGGAIQAGSVFSSHISIDNLKSADWVPYNHPNLKPGTTGYRANIDGFLGLARIEDLDDSAPVEFRISHGGAGGASGRDAEVVSVFPNDLLKVDFSTLIAGSHNGKTMMFTVHPGDPSPPFEGITIDQIKEKYPTLRATVLDAKKLGFNFVKKVDKINESVNRWQVLSGIYRR